MVHRQLGATDRPHPEIRRGPVETGSAVETVAIGHRQRGELEQGGLVGELLGVRRALEEGEGTAGPQLDIVTGHRGIFA